MAKQLITPNPNVPCQGGMCLKYVHEAFGQYQPVYPEAILSWNASTTKHEDMAFPDGLWIPLWFSIDTVPAGHVVLRDPDGSIYSTSDYTAYAHHHPSLDDLIQYYAKYGFNLTYLGWTEDVEGTAVVDLTGGNRVATLDVDDQNFIIAQKNLILDQVWGTASGTQAMIQHIAEAVNKIQPGSVDLAAIAKAVADEEAKRLSNG